MDFFSRINPAYKRASASKYAQRATPNGLMGLIGSLFGSTTPGYKSVGGQSAKAPASSSGFWSLFGTTPSYKMAPVASVAQADALNDVEAGESGVDECMPGPDAIVVL